VQNIQSLRPETPACQRAEEDDGDGFEEDSKKKEAKIDTDRCLAGPEQNAEEMQPSLSGLTKKKEKLYYSIIVIHT
jgi:hypothetical protein